MNRPGARAFMRFLRQPGDTAVPCLQATTLFMDTAHRRQALLPLTLGALGVVYGDIGTSPLYTMSTVFGPEGGVPLDHAHLVGAASTIFWVDQTEDLSVVFMTQLIPSATFNFRGQLKSIIYSSIVD